MTLKEYFAKHKFRFFLSAIGIEIAVFPILSQIWERQIGALSRKFSRRKSCYPKSFCFFQTLIKRRKPLTHKICKVVFDDIVNCLETFLTAENLIILSSYSSQLSFWNYPQSRKSDHPSQLSLHHQSIGREAVCGDNPLTNAPLTNRDVNNRDDDMMMYRLFQKTKPTEFSRLWFNELFVWRET